jgi:hypothetical protein
VFFVSPVFFVPSVIRLSMLPLSTQIHLARSILALILARRILAQEEIAMVGHP